DQIEEIDPGKAIVARAKLIERLEQMAPTHSLGQLAKAKWSLVVSLCEDLLLEDAIREVIDRQPSSSTLTIVDSPTVTLAKRTLPIYKLLGNMRDKRPPNSLALNQAE